MNTNVQEIFRTIPNFSNYQVSNLGRVKALEYKTLGKVPGYVYTRKQKILKPALDGQGYYHVRLIRDDRQVILFKVHQLVAMIFLGHDRKNTDGLIVDHINGIKTDNRLANLRIITQS